MKKTSHDLNSVNSRLAITEEACRWAYRLFLGREAESEHVIRDKVDRLADLNALRQEFLLAPEFRQNNATVGLPVLSGSEPAMPIDDELSQADLDRLFEHVQNTWQYLGETEPYYSVLTADRFERSRIDASIGEFHESGRRNVEMFQATLTRNGVDLGGFRSCLEFGCGVGRVTRWLADHFERVLAYDISRAHLELAESYLAGEGLSHVDLRHVSRVDQLERLPPVDLIYSVIVLQHNPPPIIAVMIGAFVDALQPGGVAYFQVPTYRRGYGFSLRQYLRQRSGIPSMEMHVIPQHRVFEIIDEHGGRVLEVLEDNWTGARHIEVSNTFVVRKRSP
jgi:SAM-dependent methyltransferase